MKVVPKKERLKEYKSVLNDFKKGLRGGSMRDGLCILLGTYFSFNGFIMCNNIPTAYPEFANYYRYRDGKPDEESVKKFKGLYKTDRKAWRIKVLTEIINKMEKK